MNEKEQQEFNELSAVVKADGYLALETQAKRKRYSQLLEKTKGDTEKVTLTKNEIQDMINEGIAAFKKEAKKSFDESDEGLNEAKQFGKWIKSKQPKKLNPVASLRLYKEDGLVEDKDAGLIVDWRFIKNAFNEETRRFDTPIYRISVRYDGDKIKNYEVPLGVWTQGNDFEKVEIIKQEVEEQEYSDGFGQLPQKKGGYFYSSPGLFGTKGREIPGETFEYKVYRKEITCTVKRPNGETFVISADRLNQ